jgi:hypothetical protein
VDPRDQVAQAPNVCGAAMADDGVYVADPFFPQPTLSSCSQAARTGSWSGSSGTPVSR